MAQDRARRSEARSFIQTSSLKSRQTVSAGAFSFFLIAFDSSIFGCWMGEQKEQKVPGTFLRETGRNRGQRPIIPNPSLFLMQSEQGAVPDLKILPHKERLLRCRKWDAPLLVTHVDGAVPSLRFYRKWDASDRSHRSGPLGPAGKLINFVE